MSDTAATRVMPHDRKAEQSVIGSMLIDKDAIVTASEILTRDDFYDDLYGTLFEAMVELYNSAKPVDPVVLKAKLVEMNVPEQISSMAPEYTKAILWASEQKITTGYSDGTFKPRRNCRRGECVTFLYRML